MKKLFFSLLLALGLVLSSPATPQFSGCSAGFCSPEADFVIPVSNACSTSSGTTITFTAQGIGNASPNRVTVVSINWDDSTVANTAELTAMTVGGVSMFRAVRALGDDQSSNSEIWYVANPTGTTANIVATFSTAVNAITIEVYSLIGYFSVPVTSAVGTTSASSIYNNKQVALATASRRTNVSTSLSNMTNDFSSACGANLWGVHASKRLNGNNGTLTTTISPTSSTPLVAMAIWVSGNGPSTCTEASNFLARTSGLDVPHVAFYKTLICGLVTDGVFSKLDMLHVYATSDIGTAVLNLVSSSYTGIVTVPEAVFTVDRGYNMVGGQIGGGNINTQFNPITASSPHYTQNSASLGAWTLTPSVDVLFGPIGGYDNVVLSHIRPLQSGNTYFWLNTPVANNIPVIPSPGGSVGFYAASRNSSSQVIGYYNGSSIVTANSNTSGTPPNKNYYTVALNDNGIPDVYGGQVAVAFIGGALTGTDQLNLYTRLRAWMTSVGVP